MSSSMTNRPARFGEPWTDAENRELGNLFECGMTLGYMANHHERTQGAVLGQLVRIGKLVDTDDGRYYRADALWYDYREARNHER